MKRKLLVSFLIITIILLMVSLLQPFPVRAAGTVGNGNPGSCTETALDSALAGGGLVTFNCGADPFTLTVTNQKIIGVDTTIDGGNLITLSGGNSTRIFSVNVSSSLDIKNLTLTNGSASPGGAISNSGTVTVDNVTINNNLAPGGIAGAIYNNGTLTINRSILSNNVASAGMAGAIDNEGTLTIKNSTFENNIGGLSGGAVINNGTATITATTFNSNYSSIAGAIYNHGSMTINGSNFYNNTTTNGAGAGIYNDNDLTIFSSTFSGNITSVSQQGGGLFNVIGSVANVIRSSFINNGAPGGSGGGIYNEGQLTILRDLFSGNYSSAGMGGGIYSSTSTPTTIVDSTFSGNIGGTAGGGLFTNGPTTILNCTFYNNQAGGIVNEGSDIVGVKNTILAANTPYNCFSTITSQGYNLEDAATCAFSGPGDLSNTDPMVGPLADNGGPTLTHALLKGSPAINAGTNDGCPPADQRGVPRPLLGTCDIGAYEYGFISLLPFIKR